jgi:hypothetical protein
MCFHGLRLNSGWEGYIFMRRQWAAKVGQLPIIIRRYYLVGGKTGGQQAKANSFGYDNHD